LTLHQVTKGRDEIRILALSHHHVVSTFIVDEYPIIDRFFSSSQLPYNPNDTDNRVPEGAELASLRAMAAHKQRVVDHLNQEARVARATYEEVKRRYESYDMAPQPQAIQSELHMANELAESLEKTAASLESDLGQLRGLLHPLRHCPDDILGLILEKARGTFVDAVRFSHVCQRWRAIAISSPRLWCCIDLALDVPGNAAESRVQVFLDRVEEVPATIILNFGVYDETFETAMTKIRNLGRVLQAPRVDHLYIFFEGPIEYSSILEALPNFPRHQLVSLTTVVTSDEEPQGSWNDFLSRFRSISEFSLYGGSFGPRIIQDLQSTFEGILEATVYSVQLPPRSFLRSVLSVQHLTFDCCTTTPDLEDSTKRVVLPNLRSLCIRGDEAIVPWEKVDCPLLTKISFVDFSSLDNSSLLAFLPSARMLTEIRLNPSPIQLSNIARAASQIQHLYLEGIRNDKAVSVLVDWRRFGLDGPAFPKLRLLHLDYRQPRNTISLEVLNSLIHGRCLSTAHSEAGMEATTALEELVILTKSARPFWRHDQGIAKYFNESGKPMSNGDVAYQFVGGSRE
jgi:F-box-like